MTWEIQELRQRLQHRQAILMVVLFFAVLFGQDVMGSLGPMLGYAEEHRSVLQANFRPSIQVLGYVCDQPRRILGWLLQAVRYQFCYVYSV